MAKTSMIKARVDDEVKDKLEAAAKREGRTLSNLLQRIVANWLKRNGK